MWIASSIAAESGRAGISYDRKSKAAAILAMVDGLMLLNAVGRKALAIKALRALV